ncbi:SDR family NAD(P)-dependent oxidoreductase [Fulvivirgaceae bacterium BMA10]|uniref:SDR family NAD(P)-dependent oxidoreductase n=1 Tax=Splendidivirga corallicola TaxID=3051826 RepID=A0ABT8KT61_9BACT|nr:SDR family NAD(P)-dependent oxidoreductase [Fulvivirgaceae bacterium BMA10]
MKDIVALVTGGSRGVGKGIAHELGLAGATVFVTGRSRRNSGTTDNLPGTINETAEIIEQAGGKGIAVYCDHTNDQDIAQLAEKIQKETGRLDILVNNVWGGYEEYDGSLFELPIWDQSITRWDKMMNSGVRAHYTTVKFLSPLLIRSKKPLNVHISFGDENKFLGDVQYDVAKYTTTRLAFAVSEKLKEYSVTSVAIYPGFTATERVTSGISEDQLKLTHSPRFVGRGIVNLYKDPNMFTKNGSALKVGDLGKEYGFRDIDGRQIEPFNI